MNERETERSRYDGVSLVNAKDRIIEQRMAKRRRNALIVRSLIAFLIVLIIVFIILLIHTGRTEGTFRAFWDDFVSVMTGQGGTSQNGSDEVQSVKPMDQEAAKDALSALPSAESAGIPGTEDLLKESSALASQYFFQEAIDLLKSDAGYNTSLQLQNAVASYQARKDACRAYPVDQVPHVFFHTLIRDTAKAFDGDENEPGYNQVMTTISEFNSIIQQMYEKGYVMVSVHDLCEVREDGSVGKKELRLPEGKTPFVLSQDDVSYYHYMVGDGFAQKLVVDENGKVKNTYLEDDGSVSTGDYDMVPLIDAFVEAHPDFAYHGHKGIIALTGYEGVLGYRTDEVYRTRQEDRLTGYQKAFLEAHPEFDWEQEVEQAKAVAEAMKADGWEFASHTWGHINPLANGYESTVRDTQRWLENVAPVVGDTDVLIFAFGADINDWTPYTDENPYFVYLKENGFSIFCNVDGSQKYWVQFGSNYMRQGRRNLDGYRMYYNADMLSDLFDVEKAWDASRPTPVPQM